MPILSVIFLTLAAVATFAGLFPCLGWVNWIGAPFSVMAVVVGLIGMASDKDPETQESLNSGIHLSATIVGAFLLLLGGVRCLLGGGMI